MEELIDDADTICKSIITGQYTTAELEGIAACCQSQLRVQRLQATLSVRVGDKVRFVRGRPHYLQGEVAKVTRVMNTWIMIQLERSVGKFRAGVDIRCPMTCVEIVK